MSDGQESYYGFQQLAVSVLERAVMDACGASREHRDQAIAFLASPSGAWSRMRVQWCDYAGIEFSAFTAYAAGAIAKHEARQR